MDKQRDADVEMEGFEDVVECQWERDPFGRTGQTASERLADEK